ncbi:MAG: hypothetical protein EOP35_02610 [Rubrivivax sp.]|nr:MAG: hypothetical protein EOP35_02610 [Rubrivivax sp.]
MTGHSRNFYRMRAIQARPRDPELDARNAAAAERVKQRVAASLESSLAIQQLMAAAAQLEAPESTWGTC